jgi:site-specific DNA-methyltransferase (adenine-specific)
LGYSPLGELIVARQVALKWEDREFDASALLKEHSTAEPVYRSSLGALFAGDCMSVLPLVRDGVVDTVFADPPFNLGKLYGAKCDDLKPEEEYLRWCKAWIGECVRVLKPGGAFFLYNLPKWNVLLGAHLSDLGMEFRHWIAVEISACLPIPGRLHPSHYSLLYYTKGKPKTFRRVRTPILICRHCGREVKDYGGHRDAMNPKGVTLKDVWTDIPPVRHWKFKSKDRRANALSTKLLDRVIEISTAPGDLVLDPFGGSGTTFAVCEKKGRSWIGVEIDFAVEIAARLESGEICSHKNDDFVDV